MSDTTTQLLKITDNCYELHDGSSWIIPIAISKAPIDRIIKEFKRYFIFIDDNMFIGERRYVERMFKIIGNPFHDSSKIMSPSYLSFIKSGIGKQYEDNILFM